MCAIAGIIGGMDSNNELLVANMLAATKHRGPDHTEVRKVGDYIFFGHNRLSIIDLHASANQPFVSECGRYTIVFNGEIYNYIELKNQLLADFTFRTNSDTEVLLASYRKWGNQCLDRFIGMFSFAIWDGVENLVFAARDRFGVKPFYYTQTENSFVFASEIKGLWAAGAQRVRNQKVWASFFVYGSYGMPDETFWQGIYQLQAGHFLILKQGKLKVKRWYNFEDRIKSIQPGWKEASEASIIEQYVALLNETIALRFRADVPVGFNVSGGLDSSLLLSLIKKSFPDNDSIHAYTFYTGHPDYDELPWVMSLMNTTSYPLHTVLLKSSEVPQLAEEMATFQDEPFGGLPTIAYSLLFKEARKQNTIVLLDGQGMDEAWAGYDYYQYDSPSIVQGISGSLVRPTVLINEFKNLAEPIQYPEPFSERLLNLQYRDLFFTKIPRALRFNDRVSMQHSTELREPFLDHRLVEMAFALPNTRKIKEGVGKHLLRKIAQNLLPASIYLAPKRPLQTPQREWLGHELKEWANDQITIFSELSWIDKKVLTKEWNDYLNQGGDNSFYIWQFINSVLLIGK